MSSRVAVVTDSSAYLPEGTAERHGVTVVPLQVVLGGRSLPESEVASGRVTAALVAGEQVTTSRPAPASFVETYRRLRDSGSPEIVSVHLSGEISGTADAARAAAAEVAGDGILVKVVDSRSLGMGLGYAVLTAADLAAAGTPVAEVAKAALQRALNVSEFLYVDTLEYLRRGGRIGAAQARLGSALSVKPLLQLLDGRLELLDRVRTTERALARLVEVSVAAAEQAVASGAGPIDLAVHHLAAQDRAEKIAATLVEQIGDARELVVDEVGAVVGAHVGPGMVAVVVSPAGSPG